MKILDFDVGDTVWAHGARPYSLKLKLFPWPRMVPDYSGGNPLSEGKVVLEFQRQGTKYYVVEFETHIDPVLLVYDGLTLSDDPNKPIGLYRGWKK